MQTSALCVDRLCHTIEGNIGLLFVYSWSLNGDFNVLCDNLWVIFQVDPARFEGAGFGYANTDSKDSGWVLKNT